MSAAETQVAELKNQVEEIQYELESANHRVYKLDKYVEENTVHGKLSGLLENVRFLI